MKSQIKLFAIQFIIISFFITSCQKKVNEENTKKFNINLLPISYPELNNLELNDHLRNLAFAMASITDTMFLVNNNIQDYLMDIEKLVQSEEDEVSFEKINSSIVTTGNNSNYQRPNNLFYPTFKDLVQGSLLDQEPLYYSTSPRSWAPNFYNFQAFSNFSYLKTNCYSLLRIPEWNEIKNDNSRFNKQLLVVPAEEDINGDVLLPIIGYKLNPNSQEMDTVLFQTEDEFENSDLYYVWVVDYDPMDILNTSSNINCSGDSIIQNDDFCELNCGENKDNSPSDCDPLLIRKIWIDESEISEDYKQKCGTNFQWLESRLHGKYEIAYQSMNIHSTGKVSFKGGLLNQSWTRSQIFKTKKIGLLCRYLTKGNSTNKSNLSVYERWEEHQSKEDTIEKNEGKQPKCYLSTNYKPWRDTIYFIVYEYDKPMPNRYRETKVFYRSGESRSLKYTTRNNEGPWGNKHNSINIVGLNSIDALNPTTHVYMITPKNWPKGAGKLTNEDEYTFNAILSRNGNDANTRSIKVKIKYGFF
jgi:hypothetical protein